MSGDIPVPADYDGDQRIDLSVYRPSTGQWWILRSTTSYMAASVHQWGVDGDVR